MAAFLHGIQLNYTYMYAVKLHNILNVKNA